MPLRDITNADYGDLTNTGTNYSVESVDTDAALNQKETWWYNDRWSQQLGYYKKIPELKCTIDAIAKWTVGKGFKADPITELTLMKIHGFGKDSFNSILGNMIRTSDIGGDSFAEIIRDDDGYLINIKPLDPGTIRIVVNDKGIIIRYDQVTKVSGKENIKPFDPEIIFHLSRDRVADEIHGISLIDALENVILMRNESMSDQKTLMHRHVKPVNIFHLDTDDVSEIAKFKATADKATDKGENLFIPKGAVEHTLLTVPANSTLNPLPWINNLNNYFFQATGVPQIITGSSQELTEASAKIAYMSFEQTVEQKQLYVEEQVLAQLNLEIELEFPASLQNELLSDQSKSEKMQAATPEDVSANVQPVEQRPA